MSYRSKLILVEGIPGSGKSTIAEWVHAELERAGRPCELYLEGNPAHPADYEATAYFTPAAFDDVCRRYPQGADHLHRLVERRDGACFVPYLQAARAGELSGDLLDEVGKNDIYELESVPLHRRLIAERWRAFTGRALEKEVVTVFECCFLQNPLVVLLGKHNREDDAREQVHQLADIVRPLKPVVVYLAPADVRATLERARGERPQGWVDFVSAYFSEQAWGQAQGVEGYEGMIQFHELRQQLDREILAELDLDYHVLEAPEKDWDAARAHLRRVLFDR